MEDFNIETDLNEEQGKIFMKIEGRLDAKTAPELEREVDKTIEKINSLIMDFTELEYISSAGLRVLLRTHKAMKAKKGSLIIRGANEEVQEVFTITGFSDILRLE